MDTSSKNETEIDEMFDSKSRSIKKNQINNINYDSLLSQNER
jgi:hypothetical protein